MTKPVSATKAGLKPHYKVRVVLSGAMLHLASWDKPKIIYEGLIGIADVRANWVNDPDYADVLGWIDWSEVKAITWRWSK
jgi:hypothetical protein